MDIDETESGDFYELIPAMVWATRVNPDRINLYISEETTLTLDQDAVDLICDALEQFRSHRAL